MKKLLTFFLAAVLLASGIYYGALWYATHAAMRDLGEAIRPWGELHWERIRPRVNGDVAVEGLRWHWFDVTEPVTLDGLDVRSSGLLAMHRWLLERDEPRDWVINLEELALRLQTDLFRPWAHSRRAVSLAQYPIFIERCGGQPALTSADLLRMGFDRLAVEVTLRYLGSGSGSGHRYRARFEAGLLGSLEAEWQGQRLILPWPGGAEPQWPAIDQGRLLVRDAGLMRRLSSFCAAAEDEPVAQWTRRAASEWQQMMAARGVTPSKATTRLYGRWLREGGELELTWNPEDGFRTFEQPLDVRQWQEKTGLRVVYNGTEVEGIGFAIDPDKPAENEVATRPVPVAEPDTEPAFRRSDTQRAAAWIDRRVRLRLASGRQVEGQLVAIDGRSLHIRRALEGGELVAPFRLGDIEQFEVWRRPGDHGRPVSGGEAGPGIEEFLRPGLGEIRPVPTPADDGSEQE